MKCAELGEKMLSHFSMRSRKSMLYEKQKKQRKEKIRIRGKEIVIGICVLIAAAIVAKGAMSYAPYRNVPALTEKVLDELQLEDCRNVMFVAHPDDELLWGGKHLLEDKYLVVCLTRGDDSVRRKEFEQAVAFAGGKSLILSYPDKIWHWRADWRFWQNQMEADIAAVLRYQDWELVASHNAQGEYGHQHHKMAHEMVEREYQKTGCRARLYWFGKYYVNDKVPYDLPEMEKEAYIRKRKMAKLYQSQRDTIRKMYHMLPYEYWEQAKEEE